MTYYAIFIENLAERCFKCFYKDLDEVLAVLKRCEHARMKAFSTCEEAVLFFMHGPVHPVVEIRAKFAQLIERNNVEAVRDAICQNPRYLINLGGTPTILNAYPRYNALHIAAIEGRAEICRLILQAVSSPAFVAQRYGKPATDEVNSSLLDLYLNTPDDCRYWTPLLFAVMFGWPEVVRQLVAFPLCQITVPNAHWLTASDFVCNRAAAANDTKQPRAAIVAMLRDNYIVPLIRTQQSIEPPVVGEPFSLTDPPMLVEDGRTMDWKRMRRGIRAFAGPMARDKAQEFYKRWKTPPRLNVVLDCAASMNKTKRAKLQPADNFRFVCEVTQATYGKDELTTTPAYIERAIRISDRDKGLETIGRMLAAEMQVGWQEYWELLGTFCNLADKSGLAQLEAYLRNGPDPTRQDYHVQNALRMIEIDPHSFPRVHAWKCANLILSEPKPRCSKGFEKEFM
uniref:ANKLE2 third alpha/beta domain-containing protein n=1 Tax=Anopheles dirus TaxID=7168 RepID=A0A182NVI4_9DIPT